MPAPPRSGPPGSHVGRSGPLPALPRATPTATPKSAYLPTRFGSRTPVPLLESESEENNEPRHFFGGGGGSRPRSRASVRMRAMRVITVFRCCC